MSKLNKENKEDKENNLIKTNNIHRNKTANLINKFTNDKKIVRRLERSIFNFCIFECEQPSWDVPLFIETYNKISNLVIKKIKPLIKNIEKLEKIKISDDMILETLGYENPKLVLNSLLDTPLPYYRRNIILTIYDRLKTDKRFNQFNGKKKLDICIKIENSCYTEVINKSVNSMLEMEWSDIDKENYNYITTRTLTYLDADSKDNCPKLIDAVLMESNTSIGIISSKQAFYDKFQDYYKQLEERSNVDVKYKTSKNYTCPKCKYQETIIIGAQTRSLDEGETLYANCNKCKYKWRVN